jgi:hypothetical protein
MWVLLETFHSKMQGKDIYFKGWEDYQPATTEDIQEAFTFPDREAAKLSAVYRHSEFSFAPIEVSVTVKNKAAA